MRTDEEIKRKAFEELAKLNEAELEAVNEIDFEIHFQNPDGVPERYTVFFERGTTDGKEGWILRNIISPDDLERPSTKDRGKIE